MKKLNLGCGKDIRKEYVNLDSIKLPGVDVIHDIEKFPWPFEDNTFNEVIANHVLEHIADLVKTMEEMHRVCAVDAIIKIRVPYFASPIYHTDPTHKRKFTYNTFEYFTKKSDYAYYSKARFEVIGRRILFFSTGAHFLKSKYSLPLDVIITRFHLIYERFFSYLLPASELHVLLKVIK